MVIVLAQPSLQTRSPETSHVHAQHLVVLIASCSPLILTGYIDLPALEQFVDFPVAIAQGRPTATNFLRIKPTQVQRGEHCTATAEKGAIDHDPQDSYQPDICPDRHSLHNKGYCLYSCFCGD